MKYIIGILFIFSQLTLAGSDWAEEQRRVVDYKLSVYCKQFFNGEKLKKDSDKKKMIAIKFCKGDFEAPPCIKTRGVYKTARKKYIASLEIQKELASKLDKHRTVLHLKEEEPYSKLCEPFRPKKEKKGKKKK